MPYARIVVHSGPPPLFAGSAFATAPPVLKATVAVVKQRQDGEGAEELTSWSLALAKSPCDSPVLRIEQIPMMDSVRFRDSAQSRWPFIHA